MNSPIITKQTSIEELELSVRQFNNLKKAGYSTVETITNASVKDLVRLRNLGVRDLTTILLRLDEYGFRCKDCSREEYPDLKNSAHNIIDGAVKRAYAERPRAWNYGMKKPLDKFDKNILLPYDKMIVPGIAPSKDRFYIISKDEYRIKTYGVRPGAIVVFDRSLSIDSGTLSCFENGEGFVCFSDIQKEENLIHIGRMIAVVNYYS